MSNPKWFFLAQEMMSIFSLRIYIQLERLIFNFCRKMFLLLNIPAGIIDSKQTAFGFILSSYSSRKPKKMRLKILNLKSH